MTKLELRTYFAAYELRIITLEQQFLELRYNHNHDDKGRFCSGGGGNSLDKSKKNDIIKSKHTYEKIGEIDFNDKKAVAESLLEFEQKYKNSNIEHCRVICPNGEVYEVHGDLDTVDTSVLGDKMKGSINEHNHVTGESQYSFSWDDLISGAEDGTKTELAFDEKYRYSINFNGKSINNDAVYEAKEKAKETVYNKNIMENADISAENLQHEMIKEACRILDVDYRRMKL